MTTFAACDGAAIPEWLVDYHEYMAWASAVNPWPHQQPRTPSPPQRAAAVEPPLSGATAQALIEQRRDSTNYRKAEQ